MTVGGQRPGAVDTLTAHDHERVRDIVGYIDEWVSYRAWRADVPGVQIAISLGGEVLLSRAYGVADVSTGEALTTGHLFRIASHSKSFTATVVLRLIERGALRFDDRVGDHVPSLRDAGSSLADVTVRQLLSHGSGIIRDGRDSDFWQFFRPYPDEAELLSMLVDDGAVQPPNTAFKYTNVGYSLLGLIIQAVTGQPYNDVVRGEVCETLGLENTGPEWEEARAGSFAAGHSGLHSSRDREVLPAVDTRAFSPATGFWSTAEDLVRFFSAFVPGDERLLSDASKREQQHEVWRSDPEHRDAPSYGLGLIVETIGERRWIGHSGGFPGYITNTILDPERGLVVSVLTNAIDGPAGEISEGVARLLGAALERRDGGGTWSRPDSALLGRYANLWGVIDIVRLGDRTVVIHPGAVDPVSHIDVLELVDATTAKLVAGSGFGAIGETIEFAAEDGVVTSLRGPGGMSYRRTASGKPAES